MIDVVIKLPRSGKLFAVDVTVVDGATESYVVQPDLFVNVTRGVKEAEEKKLAFYHDCPDTHELVAFAVGYQIELGDGARSFVHELATELAYKQSAGSDEPTDAARRRDAKSAESPTHCRYGDDVAHCPVMTWHMARGGAGVDVLLAPRV